MGASLRLENVVKVYAGGPANASQGMLRETRALDGLTLEVAAGEFVAITGPSGCGKSTLLHLAGGIDRPTSGRVVVDGRDLSELSESDLTLYRRRRVGTVFQFFNLIPALTALENVALPLTLDDGTNDETKASERARALLAQVGLPEKEGAFPYELSGGQMQRVAIARAAAASPPLLLADEPTGNLDSVAGGAVLDLLADLHRERGVTVLLATHSEEAARRAGRVVRLKDGRLA